MDIRKVSPGNGPKDSHVKRATEANATPEPSEVRPAEKTERPKAVDRADFSEAALRLANKMEAQTGDPVVDMIRKRIAEGFYDSPEVIDAIADALANELKRSG